MSSDIRVVAFMRAKPGEEAKVREAVLACAEKSTQEDGNLSYTTGVDETDLAMFVVIEHWSSSAARSRHLQSAHFLRLKRVLDEEQRLSKHTFTVLNPL